MTEAIRPDDPPPGRIGRYRWAICALLFFAITINYVDRQVLGVLKPVLETELGWSENDYANIVVAFQAAYAIGLLGFGRFMDLVGTRWGLAIAVSVWSVAAMAHAGARSVVQFALVRFALGLGEAGGFAVLERDDGDAALRLCGYGESSDAHHMSAPHPEGLGARLAMGDALARAAIAPDAVGYLNLHGTATPANDAVEARAIAALFGEGLHAGSTKGWTGHTLGAAGIVESVFALIALEDGLLPGTLNSTSPDAACGPQLRFDNAQRRIDYAMNNSFGFGGNNCSLVFGRA